MSVPPIKSRPRNWQACFDAGMSLRDAAVARVVSMSQGQKWARDRGLKWPEVSTPPEPEAVPDVPRAVVHRLTPAQCRHIAARMRA